MSPKHLGILGGMGPAATAHFYSLIVEACQKLGARRDFDFPKISLISARVQDFSATSTQEEQKNFESIINKELASLVALAPEVIAIPCNTAHLFLHDNQLQGIPLVHIVRTTQDALRAMQIRKIAVLATTMSTQGNLYAHRDFEMLSLMPHEQYVFMKSIERAEAGICDASDTEALKGIAEAVEARGAEALILGCTELSCIEPPKANIPILDSSKLLAEAVGKACYHF